MFSEELQKLINASLVDGVITDKERALIHKRALQEGVDPDEVDVMLDAEIEKMRQHQESAVKKVKKCPNCGEVIPAMAIKCNSCGYEFRDVEASSSIRKLFEQLNAIDSQRVGELNTMGMAEDPILNKKKEVIRTFPVPNSKEDILEFLSLAFPNAKTKGGILGSNVGIALTYALFVVLIAIVAVLFVDEDIKLEVMGGVLFFGFGFWFIPALMVSNSMKLHNHFTDVWKSKFEQVVFKATISMSDDVNFQRMVKDYEMQKKRERSTTIFGHLAIISILIIELLTLFYLCFSYNTSNNVDSVDLQYTELCKKIDDLGIPNVENYNNQKYELLKITWEPIKGGGKYEQEKKKLYLKKKRSYASQLDAFHQEHYKEIGDNSMYEQIDEIKYPDSYINE